MSDFHFLRPLFLLLIPLALLCFWWLVRRPPGGVWAHYIPAAKLRVLTAGATGRRSLTLAGLTLAWVIGALALAGPTWEQRPTPAGENRQPLVVLFDQSPSMLAEDISPNRLTRARLKLIDLLRRRDDGQTALIAYAGSPHVVAPLTQDAATIQALLPALSPEVMPEPGSNTEAAFQRALDLLDNAGRDSGDVLLITDGVVPEAQRQLQRARPAGVRVSILGVGTTEGAPIPGAAGHLRDNQDRVQIARLNRQELQSLADSLGGRYTDLQPDSSDIDYLLDGLRDIEMGDETFAASDYDEWYDMGYWLTLLLLPLALYAWRRGVVLAVAVVLLPALPQNSQALEWRDLWQTPNQQGRQALQKGDYSAATESFESPEWQGIAEYRAGNYARAAELFRQGESLRSQYNLGNALARQGQLEEAIAAYEKVLERDPEHQDARANRDKLQELLEQQQQEQEQQSGRGQQTQDQQSNTGQQQSPRNRQSGTGQQDRSNSQQQTQQGEQQQGDQPQQQGQEERSAAAEDEKGEEGQQQNGEEQNAPAEEEGSESQASAAAKADEDQLNPSSEQWLRGIPDDPSGLLRRKFHYQSQMQRQEERYGPPSPGNEDEARY